MPGLRRGLLLVPMIFSLLAYPAYPAAQAGPAGAAVALNIDFNESGAPVTDFTYGFNEKWWGATDQPNVVDKYRSTAPNNQPYYVRLLLDGEFYDSFGTPAYPGWTLVDRYLQPILAAGATPLIDFTITPRLGPGSPVRTTGIPDFAAALIAHARSAGHNPTGWGIEVLNETNEGTLPNAREHKEPAEWCAIFRLTRAAVSAVADGLTYGGPGATGFPRDYLAEIVANCGDAMDFLSIHLNWGDSLGGVNPEQRTFYDTLYDLSNNIAGGGTNVNLPARMRLIVSEYNINKDRSQALTEIWRPMNGAFVADMLAGALVINVAARDNPARGRLQSLLYYDGTDDGTGLDGADPVYEQGWWLKYPERATAPISSAYSPAYYAHRLAALAAPRGSKLLTAGDYHVPGSYPYLGDPFDRIKPFASVSTKACNGYNVLIINRANTAQTVQLNIANLPSGLTSAFRWRVYANDGFSMPLTDTGERPASLPVAASQTLSLAPFEVTLVNFSGGARATSAAAPALDAQAAATRLAPRTFLPSLRSAPPPPPAGAC